MRVGREIQPLKGAAECGVFFLNASSIFSGMTLLLHMDVVQCCAREGH